MIQWILQLVKKEEARNRLILTGLSLAIACWIFKDFLSGQKLFVFLDTGADTFQLSWPSLTYLFNHIAELGWLQFWTFQSGIGTNLLSISHILYDGFNWLLLLFGRNGLAQGLIYIYILKILLAGLFFYGWVRLSGAGERAAVCGSLLYAFSSYMMVWGQFSYFATLVVVAPLLFYGWERGFRQNRWVVFSLAVAASATMLWLYLFCMLSMGLLFYVLIQLASSGEYPTAKAKGIVLLKSLGMYVFGLGLAAALFLPGWLYQTANSIQPEAGIQLFKNHAANYWSSLLTRFFSDNGIYLNGTVFEGRLNWDGTLYESPMVYLGLFMGFMFFQINQIVEQKLRRQLLTIGGLLLLWLTLPFFSYLFEGMNRMLFRWMFLYSLLGLYLFTRVLSLLLAGRLQINYKLWVHAALLPLALYGLGLFLAVHHLGLKAGALDIASGDIWRIAGFLLVYCLWGIFWINPKFRKGLAMVLPVLLAVELAISHSGTIQKRYTLPSHTGYVDARAQFIDSLESTVHNLQLDKPEFFRIEQGFTFTWTGNDALMIRGMNSTSSYMPTQSTAYLDFLQTNQISPSAISSGIPKERVGIKSLLNIKYFLAIDDKNVPPGFVLEKTIEDKKAPLVSTDDIASGDFNRSLREYPLFIYKNKNAIPLGFMQTTGIKTDEFKKLTVLEKDRAVLQAVVLEPEDPAIGKMPLIQAAAIQTSEVSAAASAARLQPQSMHTTYIKNNCLAGEITPGQSGMLCLAIPFDQGWQCRVNGDKKPLVKIYGGLTGCWLATGKQSVVLKFVPAGRATGIIASLLCFAGLLIACRRWLTMCGTNALTGLRALVPALGHYTWQSMVWFQTQITPVKKQQLPWFKRWTQYMRASLLPANRPIWYLGSMIVAVNLILYWDYWTGKKIFLFMDAGADTFQQYWPYLTWMRHVIQNFDITRVWTFQIGLGGNMLSIGHFLMDAFNWLLMPLDSTRMAQGLIYLNALKMVLAGVFFYGWLKTFKVQNEAIFAGGFLYAFSSYMIMSGQFIYPATMVVYVPLVLWAVERALREAKWILFPIVVGLSALAAGPLRFMFAIMLLVYVLIRVWQESNSEWGKIFRLLLKFSWMYLLGLGLFGGVLWFGPDAIGMPMQPKIWEMHSSDYWISLLSRFFGDSGILMSGTVFNGQLNWDGSLFESPQMYLGLLVLLVIPQIVFMVKSKIKSSLLGLLGFLLVLILLPWCSYFLEEFNRLAFRWTFIYSAFVLFAFTLVLNEILQGRIKIIRWLWVVSAAVLGIIYMAVLYWGKNKFGIPHELMAKLKMDVLIKGAFLMLFCTWGCLWHEPRMRKALLVALPLLLGMEMIVSHHAVVNQRYPILGHGGYLEARKQYVGNMEKIMRTLQANDKGFFRVEKNFAFTWAPNDPLMIRGMNATSGYLATPQSAYLEFLSTMQIPSPPLVLSGIPRERPGIMSLLNVKYYLTQDEAAIPAGFVLNRIFEKEKIILPSTDGIASGDFKRHAQEYTVMVYSNPNAIPLGFVQSSYAEPGSMDSLSAEEKDRLAMQTLIIKGPIPREWKTEKFIVAQDKSNLATLLDSARRLQQSAMKLKFFKPNYIAGEMRLETPGVICFAIPYDTGWQCWINGRKQPVKRVYGGLTGVYADFGKKEIVLKYTRNNLKTSLGLFFLCGILIAVFARPGRHKNLQVNLK